VKALPIENDEDTAFSSTSGLIVFSSWSFIVRAFVFNFLAFALSFIP